MTCPICQCQDAAGTRAHRIVAALREEDLDQALEGGLLEAEPCSDCSEDCRGVFVAARDERRRALAARDRYRAREQRLAQRAAERQAERAAAQRQPTALPPAAAAALARALAKAGKPG